MKKKFIIFITIIYAVFSLTSCSFITINSGKGSGNKEEDENGDSSVQIYPEGVYPAEDKYDGFVAEAQARVDALPDHKFENQSFTVAVTSEIEFAPSDYSSEYNAALSKRNEMVSQKYSVSLGQIEAPADLMLSDAYASYLSGLYYSDIISTTLLITFATSALVAKLCGLKYLFSSPDIMPSLKQYIIDALDQPAISPESLKGRVDVHAPFGPFPL